jgi:hypothetical protein
VKGGVIYWTENMGGGRVLRMEIGDMMPTVLGSSDLPFDLAVDAQHVYWSDVSNNRIYKVPIDGSAQASELVITDHTPGGIALDANCVYWVEGDPGFVMKRAK